MNRRTIKRRIADPEHRRLALAYHDARGGSRTPAWKKLRDHVAAELRAEIEKAAKRGAGR
jgi:hypothetical protein